MNFSANDQPSCEGRPYRLAVADGTWPRMQPGVCLPAVHTDEECDEFLAAWFAAWAAAANQGVLVP